MKLRNKKTGEIGCIAIDCGTEEERFAVLCKDQKITIYETLAELNEEWEDYEEPKDYWYIDCDGEVYSTDRLNDFDLDRMLNIGNRFNSREEAEKAVEKLKAWKRLKDKGFRFTGINDDEDSQELITQCGILCEDDIYHLAKDADFLLLFGGEE